MHGKEGCPFTTLEGRKRQMHMFMNMEKSKYRKLNNINLYKYTIIKVTKERNTQGNVFMIKETFNGSFTEGGTMFEVLNSGQQFISVCPLIDLFNGSYLFCCEDHGFCGNITVKVIYHNYGGYWEKSAISIRKNYLAKRKLHK